MEKKREIMIPGKRYPGYGWVNEFKEFCFEPEKTGSRAGQFKEICVRDGVRVKESKKLIMVSFSIEKADRLSYMTRLAHTYNVLSKIFREYDI